MSDDIQPLPDPLPGMKSYSGEFEGWLEHMSELPFIHVFSAACCATCRSWLPDYAVENGATMGWCCNDAVVREDVVGRCVSGGAGLETDASALCSRYEYPTD